MINKLITAVLPAILVFVTADFVNTSSSIFRQEAPRQQIIRSIILILLIVAYQNIGGAIKELLKVRITQKIDEYIQFSITEKRAHLEYRHIENNETWEIIKRVAQAPAERMWDGFDSLLSLCEVFIKIFSILLVLVGQIWQVGLVIIISLIPLFSRSLKAGKNTYAAFVETTKYQRRAEYLHTVLTDRESVEERALFGYTAAIQKQWFEKYETARLITLKVKMKNYIRMKTASLITIFYSALTAAALTPSLAEGTVTLGMFTGLVSAMFSQVHSMSWTFAGILNRLADNREYLKDLTAFSKLSETDKMTAPRVIAEGPPFQTLIMRDVTLRYPGTERYSFNHCNL
jgi:ATP-binding cassette subfamily B protein